MDLKRRWFALKIKWETVRHEFKFRGLIDALFAGIVYATLIFVPVVAVLIELMLISMHRLYFFAVLFILIGAVLTVPASLAFWEQRVLVFGLAAGLFIGAGFMIFMSLRRQMAQPSKIFRGSLAELEADMAQLRRHKDVQ